MSRPETALRRAILSKEGIRPHAVARTVLLEHRTLLLLVSVYVFAGGTFLLALDRSWPIGRTSPWWSLAWALASLVWVGTQWLRHPRLAMNALAPSRVGGAVLVALIVFPFQVTFQSLKQSIAPIVGFPWDAVLHNVDWSVHGGPAWHLVRPFLGYQWFIHTLDALYMFWFLCLMGVVIWLSWTSRRELRQRGLVALALLWIIGGTIGAWVLASAGPCYTGDSAYAELLDRLDAAGPTFARGNQRGLLKLQEQNQWGPLAGISAMPSMHVGVAVLIAVITWSRNRAVGVLLTAYALVMQLGSVVLAWHYAIDGYVGALLAAACWRLAPHVLRSSTTTMPVEGQAPHLSSNH